MTTAISDIDHIVIAVGDLDRGAAAYSRLGFTLSPRALHSASMGTANHTIMLQHDYFELLTVLTATERNLRWREALAMGEGVAGLAVVPTSAPAARDAWRGQGFSPSELVSFSRPVDRPDGSRMEARFEIVSLPKGSVPGASVFACAQLTRDAVWLPELMGHANTATAIRRLVVALPTVPEGALSWSRALAGAQSAVINGGIRLRLGSHAVDLLQAGAAARRYGLAAVPKRPKAIAIEFAVADVGTCRAVLTKGGVPAWTNGERTAVAANRANGVVVMMAPEGSPLL
jgi:hypothetical protein